MQQSINDTWDAPPTEALKPLAPRVPKFTHGALLRAVLDTLNQHYAVAWAGQFNSGTFIMDGHQGKKRAIRCNVMPNGFACPDILGQMSDGRFLAVEVKVGRDTFRPGQAEFLNFVQKSGGVSILARSIKDVTFALEA
jgi:hypothetical protein